MHDAFIIIHACGAIVGLLSGYAAMLLRKGSGLHGAAGSVFFVSMAAMSATGAYIAVFYRPNRLNMVVGLLTLYLVVTAWRAARQREAGTGPADVGAFLYIATVAATAIFTGLEAANTPRGMHDGMPAPIYFVFGSIALLCAVSDVRMLRRGGVSGGARLARHLWRMCLALLIATVSLYPGQAKLLPLSVRESSLVFAPHLLLVGSMVFWWFRVKRRRRIVRQSIAPEAGTETLIGPAVRA